MLMKVWKQTRIQNQDFESRVGGMTIMKEMMKHEGLGGFFKGFTPKVRRATLFSNERHLKEYFVGPGRGAKIE